MGGSSPTLGEGSRGPSASLGTGSFCQGQSGSGPTQEKGLEKNSGTEKM